MKTILGSDVSSKPENPDRFRRWPSLVCILFLCASFAQHANGAIVELTIFGTVDTFGSTVFGENGAAIPFAVSITYDTSLDTNTNFFNTGNSIGADTAANPFYGYSASGIVATDLTFGTGVWDAADILPFEIALGIEADFWLDTDISIGATPTLGSFSFESGNGFIAFGEVVYSGGDISMENIGFVEDFGTAGIGNITISGFTLSGGAVPEPSVVILGLAAIPFLCLRRRRRI